MISSPDVFWHVVPALHSFPVVPARARDGPRSLGNAIGLPNVVPARARMDHAIQAHGLARGDDDRATRADGPPFPWLHPSATYSRAALGADVATDSAAYRNETA